MKNSDIIKHWRYPEIHVKAIWGGYEHKTSIRIKRDSKWYDVVVSKILQHQDISIDNIIDDLILHKLFWQPMELKSKEAEILGFKGPSENQNDTTDDLLDDVHRVNKLKERLELKHLFKI